MMELTGSLTEQRFRSNLSKLQNFLLDHPRHRDIVQAVTASIGERPELFALESFPDNGNDHFVLLVNAAHIIKLDASTQNEDPILIESRRSVDEFKRRLSMINQIMIAVALDMTGQG